MADREKVILFGRGMVYQRKKERIFEQYEVLLFLDNEVDASGLPVLDEKTGKYALNPIRVLDYPGYPIILLSYALGDMSRQLLGLGIERERIRFGVSMEPFNTFEKMLFGDGAGTLYLDGRNVIYQNDQHNLRLETNPSDLEAITDKLRDTLLYQQSKDMLANMPLCPLDDTYGMNRGTPVDRYYIEKFLEANQSMIKGTTMEIGDREYTVRYGKERVQESVILHVKKSDPSNNMICGNFATGEGIREESVDCLICTQTLPFIYDIHKAAENIVRVLKKGGTALITVGGISQIISYEKTQFGHYWGLTDMSLRMLFEGLPDVKSVEVNTYGNVKSAAAFLYGISHEEMDMEELEYNDPNFQLIITAIVTRK